MNNKAPQISLGIGRQATGGFSQHRRRRNQVVRDVNDTDRCRAGWRPQPAIDALAIQSTRQIQQIDRVVPIDVRSDHFGCHVAEYFDLFQVQVFINKFKRVPPMQRCQLNSRLQLLDRIAARGAIVAAMLGLLELKKGFRSGRLG